MSLRTQIPMVVALGLVLCVVDMSFAQPGRGGRGGSQMGQIFNNPIMLLRNEKVAEELELVDDQQEELQALQEEAMQGMRDMFMGMRDMSSDEREEKMEEVGEMMEKLRDDVDGILLPHQQKRLKQLNFQNQNRRRGGTGVSDSLADELDISEKQMEEMEKITEKGNEDIQKAIAKMREDIQKKVRGVLDTEQRQKWDELIGSQFDFGDQRSRWGGQQRGSDRGGDRGGDREGRGRSDF